ncbi:MAG: helix-hairpin-helix domain-containing protein [Desulfotomaculum sp.]|nr:helix-hairpin-helix domain-containing protein [Desulfotomaculum sp.]
MFDLGRREQLVIIILLSAVLFGSGYRLAQHKYAANFQQPVLVAEKEEKDVSAEREVVVHVSGAVEKPGVYRLKQNSRVIDAVQMAGGEKDADLNKLNLAAPLVDGQKIYVPPLIKNKEGQAVYMQGDNSLLTGNGGHLQGDGGRKININAAGEAELSSLPGIGPALSKRIIEYRSSNGMFKSIEEIKKVPGIGDKKYESIKNLISVY